MSKNRWAVKREKTLKKCILFNLDFRVAFQIGAEDLHFVLRKFRSVSTKTRFVCGLARPKTTDQSEGALQSQGRFIRHALR